MKPLFFWRWGEPPSLREIDDRLRLLAERGFAVAVEPCGGFMTARFFEALRGACRSAGRYGAELYLCDDVGPFSGSGGGEVTSAPELRARLLTLIPSDALGAGEEPLFEKDGKAVVIRRAGADGPADVFGQRAARAFVDAIYRRLGREAARFLGCELKGFVTRTPFVREADGRPTLPYCEELFAEAESEGLSPEELFFGGGAERYMALARELAAKTFLPELERGASGLGLRLLGEIWGEKIFRVTAPEGPRFLAGAVRSLCRGIGEGLPAVSGEPFGEERPCAVGYALWADAARTLCEAAEGMRPVEGEAVGKEGQGLALRRLRREGAELYLLTNGADEAAGVELALPEGLSAHALDIFSGELVYAGEGSLRAEIPAGGAAALLCSAKSPEASAGGLLPGFAVPSEGAEPLAARPLGAEKGASVYEARLPEDGAALVLEGDFACAEVRVGRRRETLVAPPFALKLYAGDAGRAAEITLYPAQNGGSASLTAAWTTAAREAL